MWRLVLLRRSSAEKLFEMLSQIQTRRMVEKMNYISGINDLIQEGTENIMEQANPFHDMEQALKYGARLELHNAYSMCEWLSLEGISMTYQQLEIQRAWHERMQDEAKSWVKYL